MEFNTNANVTHALNHVEELMASGVLRIYVQCDNCHLRDTCENEAIGCTNYKLYKRREESNESGVKKGN